jgi:hypothetical protein
MCRIYQQEDIVMEESLWMKWHKHCKSGGLIYAVYRGVKYAFWCGERRRLRRQNRDIAWKKK